MMKQKPIKCPYCHANASLRPASVVYGLNRRSQGKFLYLCDRWPACDAYVGAHRSSLLPMGTLADKGLRRRRMAAHAALRRVVDSGLMTKKQLYRCIQAEFGIPEEEAHIGKFSELRCQKVIDLCDRFFRPFAHAA